MVVNKFSDFDIAGIIMLSLIIMGLFLQFVIVLLLKKECPAIYNRYMKPWYWGIVLLIRAPDTILSFINEKYEGTENISKLTRGLLKALRIISYSPFIVIILWFIYKYIYFKVK